MTVAGLAAGLAYGARAGDMREAGRVLGAALVHVPAAWVLTGIVVAVFGLAPRLVAAGWPRSSGSYCSASSGRCSGSTNG